MAKISFILLFLFLLVCLGYWYSINPDEKLDRDIICRHCRKNGHVYTKPVKKKTGVLTTAHCGNCGSTWQF